MPDEARRPQVLSAARARRLVMRRPESFSVDARRVGHAIRRSGKGDGLHRSDVLSGMGEMMAHAPEGFDVAQLLSKLGVRARRLLQARRTMRALLRSAGRRAQEQFPAGSSFEVTAREAIRDRTFTRKVRSIARGRDAIRPGMYGLFAVCDVALLVAPAVLGAWLRQDVNHGIASAVLHHLLRRFRLGVDAQQLLPFCLRTGVPVLQAMAVNACLEPVLDSEQASDRLACVGDRLRASPTSAHHAFALATIAFDRVRIQWHRVLGSVCADAPSREEAQTLVQVPRKALHFPMPAQRRRTREASLSEAQGDTARHRVALVERLVEDALDLLVEHAPAEGLATLQVEQLTDCFTGDPAQLLVRLAERIQAQPLRDQVVEMALDVTRALLLPEGSRDPFEYPLSSSEDWEDQLHWFARALRLKRTRSGRGLDREVGLLLTPLTKAAGKVFDRPFSAHRQTSAYTSALQRRLLASWMALHIGHGIPGGPDPLPKLVEVAVIQAKSMLRACRSDVDDQGWQFQVIGTLIALMDAGEIADGRAAWFEDDALPPLVRCLCIWTSPSMLRSDPKSAVELFSSALLDMNVGDEWRTAEISLELLDIVTAQAHHLHDPCIQADVVHAWEASLVRWHPMWRHRLHQVAAILLQALQGVEPQRQRLLRAPDFARSRCARWCAQEMAENLLVRPPKL